MLIQPFWEKIPSRLLSVSPSHYPPTKPLYGAPTEQPSLQLNIWTQWAMVLSICTDGAIDHVVQIKMSGHLGLIFI